MSGQVNAAPVDWKQRHVDQFEAAQTHLDGRQAQIHTAMPGRIVSFNPATMTAVVQPALQAIHTAVDGSRTPLDISPVQDVPVHFPAGGGYTLTFPVKPGDECLIVFSERSIDNWHQHGGNQEPSDWRMHDINDAVVHVGLRSQPGVLKPAVHADNVQMRSDDGTRFVEINNASNSIRTVVGSVTATLDGNGNIVEIVAPSEIKLTTPVVTVSGVIDVQNVDGKSNVGTFNGIVRATIDFISNTVSGHNHVHTGVQPGGGDTGLPVP